MEDEEEEKTMIRRKNKGKKPLVNKNSFIESEQYDRGYDTVLATSLRDDNKNLNAWCPSKCKLPWCNTPNEYWSMLANTTVNVLDRFKPGRNGKIPKCEHGVEASLTLYRYTHRRDTVKTANDPNAEKHMELHDQFFSNVNSVKTM